MAIEHISDTARWVAVYRAMETERPDALFRDPFARGLAGERGEQIVAQLHRGQSMAWAMSVRTAVFDELIMEVVTAGRTDLVLNLAAGLDTRPWRLPLPPALRWIDVDLNGILDYKTGFLRDERPVCQYEAVATDLADAAARAALLARFGVEARCALVITEGLLIYLAADHVQALGRELYKYPAFRWWLTDLASPRLLEIMNRHWGKALLKGNAPFQFAPAEGDAYFQPLGWRTIEFRSTVEEAKRLKREMRWSWLWRALARISSAKQREEFRKMSGYLLLERAKNAARSVAA